MQRTARWKSGPKTTIHYNSSELEEVARTLGVDLHLRVGSLRPRINGGDPSLRAKTGIEGHMLIYDRFPGVQLLELYAEGCFVNADNRLARRMLADPVPSNELLFIDYDDRGLVVEANGVVTVKMDVPTWDVDAVLAQLGAGTEPRVEHLNHGSERSKVEYQVPSVADAKAQARTYLGLG